MATTTEYQALPSFDPSSIIVACAKRGEHSREHPLHESTSADLMIEEDSRRGSGQAQAGGLFVKAGFLA